MKLYQVTWELDMIVIGFYSPQFVEAPSEVKAIISFITMFEKHTTIYSPQNIRVVEVCEMSEIIKYEQNG